MLGNKLAILKTDKKVTDSRICPAVLMDKEEQIFVKSANKWVNEEILSFCTFQ